MIRSLPSLRPRGTAPVAGPILVFLAASALLACGAKPGTVLDAGQSASTAASGQEEPGAADRAEPFSVEDLRADFAELYSTLEAAHFDLFVQTPKEELDAHYRATLDGLTEPLDPFEARIRFQQFVSRVRIGHTRIDFPFQAFAEHRQNGGKTVPFFFRVVDGRVRITESLGAGDLRLGDEILAVEGVPAGEFLARLRRHISSESEYMAHALLEFWFPQLLWVELGAPDSITVRARGEGEAPRTVTVPLRTAEEIRQAAENAPPSLQLDWNARSWRMLDAQIGYLRPGPFYEPTTPDDYDPRAFVQFVDQAFEGLLEAGATDLLIDLRANPGGDNSFSDPMVAWFADRPFRFNSSFRIKLSETTRASNQKRADASSVDGVSKQFAELYRGKKNGERVDYETAWAEPRQGRRFEGRVYLLVNRHSFSNTVTVAALVQDFGFGVVLGEETSDLATTYGAMERFVLPRTGIEVGYPKAQIVRPSGDLALRGVVPDIPIETPLVEGPDDPVLGRAVEIIQSRRPGVRSP